MIKTRALVTVVLIAAAFLAAWYAMAHAGQPAASNRTAAQAEQNDANGLTGSELPPPDNSPPAVNKKASGENGSTVEPDSATGDGGKTPPAKFVSTYTSAIQFDYGRLPENAGGTLQLYGKFEGRLVNRFEFSLAEHVAKTGRLPAGPYFVLLVGDTVWNSGWFDVAEKETYTVMLRTDDDAQSVAVAVVDGQTGEPLEGAVLKLECVQTPALDSQPIPGVIAVTGADGRATLTGQPVGAFSYAVEKLGYVPASATSYAVARGECDLGVIGLLPATGEVTINFDFAGVENYVEATIRLEDAASRSSYGHPLFETDSEHTVEADANLVFRERSGKIRFVKLVPGRLYIASVYVSLGEKRRPTRLPARITNTSAMANMRTTTSMPAQRCGSRKTFCAFIWTISRAAGLFDLGGVPGEVACARPRAAGLRAKSLVSTARRG